MIVFVLNCHPPTNGIGQRRDRSDMYFLPRPNGNSATSEKPKLCFRSQSAGPLFSSWIVNEVVAALLNLPLQRVIRLDGIARLENCLLNFTCIESYALLAQLQK